MVKKNLRQVGLESGFPKEDKSGRIGLEIETGISSQICQMELLLFYNCAGGRRHRDTAWGDEIGDDGSLNCVFNWDQTGRVVRGCPLPR